MHLKKKLGKQWKTETMICLGMKFYVEYSHTIVILFSEV